MTEVTLRWAWTLQSPLHCGSGVSRPGRADRLVQLDEDRRPVIVGDAVKGTLRMSAEHIAAWLGQPQNYRRTSADAPYVSEPAARPLALVFGGDADAHFEAASLVGTSGTAVFTSTAIKADTGTADDNTLRSVEIVPKGAQFESAVSVWVPDDEAKDVATLLVSALAATESIGAKAGIGWGAAKLAALSVQVGGAATHPDHLVSRERIASLRAALTQAHVPQRWLAISLAQTPADMVWFEFQIAPKEPLTLGRGADVSNTATTERAIRATTLRGACARSWLRNGASRDDILSWLHHATRWSPGFPMLGGVIQAPVPVSLMNPKHDRSHPLHKRALFDYLTGGDHPLVPDPAKPETKIVAQWVGAGGDWMAWTGTGPRDRPTPIMTRMHVARDYETGSKVTGALFAREALAVKDAEFVAFACLPAGIATTPLTTIALGKRNSAGSGLAEVVVSRIDFPSLSRFGGTRFTDGVKRDRDVYVQLLSPALVRDPATGHPLRTVDVTWWVSKLELEAGDVKVEERLALGPLNYPKKPEEGLPVREKSTRRTVIGRRGGWMVGWGHGRAAAGVIEQGSVWRLHCKDDTTAEKIRARFPEGLGQIGERRHEGFGWCAVDPAWLGISRDRGESVSEGSASPQPPAAPWPGAGALDRAQQVVIIAALPSGTTLRAAHFDVRGALHELARQAREARDAASVERVRDFLGERLKRERDDAWKQLEQLNALPNICWESADHLRFALEVLLIRATPFTGE